jgi:hypothetical protein
MWRKVKNTLCIIGGAVVALFLFLIGKGRKDTNHTSIPPDPTLDPAYIAKREELRKQLREKVKAIEEKHKEDSDAETISDLINKHNDLYND